MKKRLGLILFSLTVSLFIAAQTHITIENPATWSGEALRPYIGQTVIFDVPMIVCGNANGNYTVSPWRRFQPESHGFRGTSDYNATVRVNDHCMFSITNVPAPSSAMDEPGHRCGEKIIGLKATVNSTSSLTWQGGTWSGNTRAELKKNLPDLGDYRLLVCGFNVENYFTSVGCDLCPESSEDHKKQRAKVSKALKQINADIFGLVELQLGNKAIAEIVSDLNTNIPERHYVHFNDPTSGTSQKVDFVYDANVVEPWGPPNLDNTELQYRHKMVGFRELATGEQFIYSINHFKAMNTGDEYRRVNEATAVIKQYNDYRTAREKDVLFMGDLNCYAFTAPIKQFTDRGFIDMHRAFHADSSYSYMFNGLTSYIDHAISNNTLFPQVTGMAGYHINSDEDDRYNYQKSNDQTMFRCSDHDPVLVGLKLDSTLVFDPSPSINNADIVYEHQHLLILRNAYKENYPSYYRIYSIRGDLIEHQPITSLFQEVQLPEVSGVYIFYIYFDGQVYQKKFIVP